MLDIDRDASRSVRDQLVEQLRYQIARGHFRVNDTLPSTRALGEQLNLSFHTVRKAYRVLVDEGVLASHAGRGYTVKERTPFSKSERVERGATVVHSALQRLIGLGMSDGEITALVQEQLALLDHADAPRKLLVSGLCSELGALCARQISRALQQPVRAVPLDDLANHADADFLFVPYPRLNETMQAVPRADTFGIGTHLPAPLLERVARCTDADTVGLLTRDAETIGPLSRQLRDQTAFAGQFIAASIDQRAEHVDSFIDQLDILLVTPLIRRRVRSRLGEDAPSCVEIAPVVSQDALDALVQAVPG